MNKSELVGFLNRKKATKFGMISYDVTYSDFFLLCVFLLCGSVCSPPFEPKNGGYTCHPSPCHRLTDGTVMEYFCDEGYTLKGDYKYITCQNGEWSRPLQISCVFSQGEFSLQSAAKPLQCPPVRLYEAFLGSSVINTKNDLA